MKEWLFLIGAIFLEAFATSILLGFTVWKLW